MQALLIYMLLRLHQGETRYNDFDGVLLSTMWVRLSSLHLPLNVFYSLHDGGLTSQNIYR
jgi:hypothetical protein